MKLAPAIRVVLTVIGLVLVVGAFVFVLFVGAASNPPPLRIVVAAADIPAGDTFAPGMYRVEDQIIDPGLARLYVQEHELDRYHGALVVDVIRRGDPVSKVRLATGEAGASLRRYTLVLTDPEEVVMTLPVNPAVIPGKVSAGDHVNILFVAGRDIAIARFPDPTEAPPTPTPEPTRFAADIDFTQPTPTPTGGMPPELQASPTPTLTPTPIIVLPLADLMLERVPVLEVIHQQIQNPNYAVGGDSRAWIDGPIQAIVVRVPRAYQTVLAFAAAAGDLRYAIASPALEAADILPGAGVDWKRYAEMYRWKVMESIGRGETLTETLFPLYTPVVPPTAPAPPPSPTPLPELPQSAAPAEATPAPQP